MQVKPKTREMTPEAFLRRVKRLYGEVRSEITKALKEAGNDPKKLPKKLWEEIEEKERHALALLLMGFGASAMNNNLYEWQTYMQATGRELPEKRSDQAYRKLQTLANKRARWTARRVNRTTKRRLREQFRDFEPGDSTLTNVRDVISDSRINTTFRTEMRRSLAIGTQAVYEVGRSTQEVHSVLILGSCHHCEVCPLFDRVEITEVDRYFPQGIPLHPNCCCDQVLVFGDRQDLIEEGSINPFPNHKAIRQAMRDAGFDIPPKRTFRKSVTTGAFRKSSKPEIRDGDGDGLIYDGTKDERPAGSYTDPQSVEGGEYGLGIKPMGDQLVNKTKLIGNEPFVGYPVTRIDDNDALVPQVKISPDGEVTVRAASWIKYGQIQLSVSRAADVFFWPYGSDVYVRVHHNKEDYEYLKSGHHHGSTNHATDESEGGLSVSKSPEFPSKYAYLVRGKRIGEGSDDEPLIDHRTATVVSGIKAFNEFQEEYRDDLLQNVKRLGWSEEQYIALKVRPKY